jgi:hypothetical protein
MLRRTNDYTFTRTSPGPVMQEDPAESGIDAVPGDEDSLSPLKQ